jgi:hypothetical protein
MSTGRRIVLHVGAHKTGTTSIQKTLFTAKQVLSEHDIDYLGLSNADKRLQVYFARNYKTTALFPKVPLDEIKARTLARANEVERAICDSGCSTIILSNEHFCLLDKKAVLRLKQFFERFGDVYIIYYYRDILPWMASFSQELIRSGRRSSSIGYDEAVRYIYDFPMKFADAFGDEKMRFVRFEDAVKTGEGVTDSLLRLLQLPILRDMGLTETRENSGASAQAVHAMSMISRLFGSRGAVPKHLWQAIAAIPGDKYRINGLREDQISDYAHKRLELMSRFNMRLMEPADISLSEEVDPIQATLLEVIDLYKKN